MSASDARISAPLLAPLADFYVDRLGFVVTDRVLDERGEPTAIFLRTDAEHHAMAIFRSAQVRFDHFSCEAPDWGDLRRWADHMAGVGVDLAWGIGRHGPGSNVFSYFIEPNGFVAEYTTELDQLDDATHVPQDATYWQKIMPGPDRWGTAGPPSNRMRAAMSGELYLGDERCEDIIGRKLG